MPVVWTSLWSPKPASMLHWLVPLLANHSRQRKRRGSVRLTLFSFSVWNETYSEIVLTFLPAPLKPYFLMVLRSQPTVGPSSIFLLVLTKNEAESGLGFRLLAVRNAASSS